MGTRLEMSQVGPGVHHVLTRYAAWVLLEEGSEVTVVDSGWPGERGRLLASLERIGRSGGDLAAVLLTHAHRDHLGNAAFHLPQRGVLLAGDALVTGQPWERPGTVRPQLLHPDVNHDHRAAVRSLDRLRPLDASVVLCGHGAPYRGTPARAVAQALDPGVHR